MFLYLCFNSVVFSGACGGLTEPGEDHVSVLPVHGDIHGPSSVRGKTTHRSTGQELWLTLQNHSTEHLPVSDVCLID